MTQYAPETVIKEDLPVTLSQWHKKQPATRTHGEHISASNGPCKPLRLEGNILQTFNMWRQIYIGMLSRIGIRVEKATKFSP